MEQNTFYQLGRQKGIVYEGNISFENEYEPEMECIEVKDYEGPTMNENQDLFLDHSVHNQENVCDISESFIRPSSSKMSHKDDVTFKKPEMRPSACSSKHKDSNVADLSIQQKDSVECKIDEGVQLPKNKSNEVLELARSNIQNAIKCEVKGQVLNKVIELKLEEATKKRKDQGKTIEQLKMDEMNIENDLYLEVMERVHLEKEMNNTGAIIDVLKEQFATHSTRYSSIENEKRTLYDEFKQLLEEYRAAKSNAESTHHKNQAKILELSRTLKEEHTAYVQEVAKIKLANEQMLNETGEIQRQTAHVKANIEDMAERVHVAKRELDGQLSEVELLKESVKEADDEIVKLKQEKEDQEKMFQETIQSKQEALSELNERLDKSNQLLQQTKLEIKASKNYNLELMRRKENAEELYEKAKEDYENLKANLEMTKANNAKKLETAALKCQEIQETIIKVDSDTVIIIEELDDLDKKKNEVIAKKEAVCLQHNILEASKSQLQRQISENDIVLAKYNEQRQAADVKLESLRQEFEATLEKCKSAEARLELERNEHEAAVAQLKDGVAKAKEKATKSEGELEQKFKLLKDETEAKMVERKVANRAKLDEVQNQIRDATGQADSLKSTHADFKAKILAKVELRNSLSERYKKLQDELKEIQSGAGRKSAPQVQEPPAVAGVSPKPTGILKSPGTSSVQPKKVSFKPGLNWDSLSESSTDAFFNEILAAGKKQETNKKEETKTIRSADDLFEELLRHSPPVREKSTSKKRPRFDFTDAR